MRTPPRLPVLSASGALLAAALTVFTLTAHIVDAGHTAALDNWILRSFRSADNLNHLIGPDWLIRAVRDVTSLGSATLVLPFSLVVAGHFLLIRHRNRDAVLVLLTSIGAIAANELLKNLFDRHRPLSVPALAETTSSSFPSGHAMLSASVYLTLGLLLARAAHRRLAKAYYLVVAAGVVLAVGLSRVMLGVHYPSDILAGWFAGLAWALLCHAIASWPQPKKERTALGDPLSKISN